MKDLAEFLGRAPFVLLGLFGILSIVGTFMTLEENLALTLEAWRTVTRPIWDFLLGWFFQVLGWDMPWLLKDYLSLGIVFAGMQIRALSAGRKRAKRELQVQSVKAPKKSLNRIQKLYRAAVLIGILFPPTLIALFAWPIFIFLFYRLMLTAESDRNHGNIDNQRAFSTQSRYMKMVFWETGVYLLFIVAVNFLLVSVLQVPRVRTHSQ